jgi:hypothetical protein
MSSEFNWSSGRAAEGDGLENRFTLSGNGGSNPSCSVGVLFDKNAKLYEQYLDGLNLREYWAK